MSDQYLLKLYLHADWQSSLLLVLSCSLCIFLYLRYPFSQSRLPLPPGPRGWPIVGNISSLPRPGIPDWEHWWSFRIYGPLSSIKVFGQTFVLINHPTIAFDLLNGRSTINSSRPRTTFLELCGWSHMLGNLPYNSKFRQYRKTMHEVLGNNKLSEAKTMTIEAETRKFLVQMLISADVSQHARIQASAIMLQLLYGYTIQSHPDPFVELADVAMRDFGIAVMPGKWLVDQLPFLRYLPAWLPGGKFKRTAQEFSNHMNAFVSKPFEFTERQVELQTADQSFVSSLLNRKLDSEERSVAMFSAASLFAGGSDTSTSTVEFFFLAMAMYPDIQEKAQNEIDQVVGRDRLPSLKDLDLLPYVTALIKECFRWHPVAPLAIPHYSIAEDEYEGYRIPKNAVLLANVWGFTHDPNLHSEPFEFRPERFLGPNQEPDPITMVFGFGRRLCPGKDIAIASIQTLILQSLGAFRIGVPAGIQSLSVKVLPGIVSHPAPYDIDVQLRYDQVKEMIAES